jgi:CID domain
VAVDDGGALWDPPTCAAPIQDAVEAAAPEPGPEPEPEPEPKPEQENGGLEAVARLDERLDAASMAQLEALLDGLDTTRGSIARAMVFCVDQSRRAGDVAAVLGRRLLSLPARGATPAAGLGVVYLVADVLANGDSAGAHAHRARLGAVVELAFRDGLRVWLDAMPGRIAAHGVAVGVTRVLDAWRQSRVFPEPFVEALRRAVFGDADVHAL